LTIAHFEARLLIFASLFFIDSETSRQVVASVAAVVPAVP